MQARCIQNDMKTQQLFKLATIMQKKDRLLKKLLLFLMLSSAFLRAETASNGVQDENSPPDNIPREELPLAVIWGLSFYTGATIPWSPDAFAEFWKPGLNLTIDMDILLRNDIVLGLSFSYSKLKFNTQEFWRRRGVSGSGDLGGEFDIPIGNLLLSYRGRETFLLPPVKASYEVGAGFYSIQNTDVDKIYISDFDYVLAPRDRIEVGLFSGLRLARLVTDTMQISVKGRYHYVFKAAQHHQYFDVLLGISLL